MACLIVTLSGESRAENLAQYNNVTHLQLLAFYALCKTMGVYFYLVSYADGNLEEKLKQNTTTLVEIPVHVTRSKSA